MQQSLVYKIILVLLFIGLFSVIVLSAIQFTSAGLCPPVFGIPACYILLISISLAIISHLNLINDRNLLFFVGVGVTWLIAIYASFNQIYNLLECPKEPIFQTPMCYLSFLLFSLVLVLKIWEIKSVGN